MHGIVGSALIVGWEYRTVSIQYTVSIVHVSMYCMCLCCACVVCASEVRSSGFAFSLTHWKLMVEFL